MQGADRLVQYIVVRADLRSIWPLGALIAQGAHASVAAVAKSASSPDTIAYLQDLENMTKCVLGIEGEEKLRALAERITEAGIAHHLWIEQPENLAVALATAPASKSVLTGYFRDLKLLK